MARNFTIEAKGTPDYPAMMLAVIFALKDIKRAATIHEIVARVIKNEEVTEEDLSHLMKNGTTKLQYHLHWSCSCLKPSGILEQPRRGLWKLTEAGLEVSTLNQTADALDKYRESVADLPKKRNFIISPNTPPNIHGVMLATVIAIKELGGSGHIYEIIACVIKNERISEKEQSYTAPQDHRTKLNYYLAWARTYLKRSGDLESLGRGVWALTELGFGIDTSQDAEEAFNRYREEINERQKERDTENWKSVLLGILKKTDPNGFEELCGLILRKIGFIKVEITALPNRADGGVDGVGFLRENLLSRKIYFQCKRTKNSISVDGIRDFRGALDGRANQGLFITTSSFTDPAVKEAVRDGALLIDLIDGDELCDLLKENDLGFKTENGQKILTPEWFNKYNIKPTPNPQQQGT